MLVRGPCRTIHLHGHGASRHISEESRAETWSEVQVPIACLVRSSCCRIEYLHSKGILYRDIKPENFMLGVKNELLLKEIMALSEFLISNFPQAMQADMQVMADFLVAATPFDHFGLQLCERSVTARAQPNVITDTASISARKMASIQPCQSAVAALWA